MTRSNSRSAEWLLWLVPLLVPAAVAMRAWPRDMVVEIGTFATTAQGQRASLWVLAEELKRHPNATSYSIQRREGTKRIQMLYDVGGRHLFDDHISPGLGSQCIGVTPAMIREVAAHGGTMRDFSGAGVERW